MEDLLQRLITLDPNILIMSYVLGGDYASIARNFIQKNFGNPQKILPEVSHLRTMKELEEKVLEALQREHVGIYKFILYYYPEVSPEESLGEVYFQRTVEAAGDCNTQQIQNYIGGNKGHMPVINEKGVRDFFLSDRREEILRPLAENNCLDSIDIVLQSVPSENLSRYYGYLFQHGTEEVRDYVIQNNPLEEINSASLLKQILEQREPSKEELVPLLNKSIEERNEEIVETLLDYDVKSSLDLSSRLVDEIRNQTIDEDWVRLFVDAGANPFAYNSRSLIEASANGDLGAIKYFVDELSMNPSIQNCQPIKAAIVNRKMDIIGYLAPKINCNKKELESLLNRLSNQGYDQDFLRFVRTRLGISRRK